MLCMSLEAREVAGVWGTVHSSIKYFVLDCRYFSRRFPVVLFLFIVCERSRAEFAQGRLPTAMLMDVDAYRCCAVSRPFFPPLLPCDFCACRADPESMQPVLDIVLGEFSRAFLMTRQCVTRCPSRASRAAHSDYGPRSRGH
jgi:hypothetical protein